MNYYQIKNKFELLPDWVLLNEEVRVRVQGVFEVVEGIDSIIFGTKSANRPWSLDYVRVWAKRKLDVNGT